MPITKYLNLTITLFALIILTILTINANAAEWVPVTLSPNFDHTAYGFCKRENQCFVSSANNENIDDKPEAYWESNPANKPKCIATGQYILDHYCKDGEWQTRTQKLALALLAIAKQTNSQKYTLFCDSYKNILNRYEYQTQYGLVTTFLRNSCQPATKTGCLVNNMCILKYDNSIAFGISINTQINHENSALQAFNLSKNTCSAVDNQYTTCSENIWYDPTLKIIIYAQTTTLPAPLQEETLTQPYEQLRDYIMQFHNSNIAALNYTNYEIKPQFDTLFIAKNQEKEIFAFKQSPLTLSQFSYAGWMYTNINMPQDICTTLIKKMDSRAQCEQQPEENNYYIATVNTPLQRQTQTLINQWQDMTTKAWSD